MPSILTVSYTHLDVYKRQPYNTGAKDWKYNNDYVDGSDAYRHSKWLSMMEKRLKIAKKLLNPKDSVLIVTIDEKEYLHLGCLLEEMFPEAEIQMISSVINPKGSARAGRFSRVDEYIFFAFLGKSEVFPCESDMLRAMNEDKRCLLNTSCREVQSAVFGRIRDHGNCGQAAVVSLSKRTSPA